MRYFKKTAEFCVKSTTIGLNVAIGAKKCVRLGIKYIYSYIYILVIVYRSHRNNK